MSRILGHNNRRPKLAVLFWFYKEPEICVNRLELLKRTNSDLKVFGLYGGPQKLAPLFRKALGIYLDDFYVSPSRSSDWKWMNGDLVILDWYARRGRHLTWDSVVVVQWDMLVFAPLRKIFKEIKRGEIFLSGFRTISPEIECRWDWTKPRGTERGNFVRFMEYVRTHYGYHAKARVCLFVLQVFPRVFCKRYLKVGNRNIGMLEYKIPTYAKIFGVPIFRKNLGVQWDEGKKSRPLNAIPREINSLYIKRQLRKRKGWRIFHPYYRVWPTDLTVK
ncbi:MAG: hypothetical protein Q8Q41_02650 [bacterium]|nr:hypothetical protein [bacterium]